MWEDIKFGNEIVNEIYYVMQLQKMLALLFLVVVGAHAISWELCDSTERAVEIQGL